MGVPKEVDIIIAGEQITGSVVDMRLTKDEDAFGGEVISRSFTVSILITEEQHEKIRKAVTEGEPE